MSSDSGSRNRLVANFARGCRSQIHWLLRLLGAVLATGAGCGILLGLLAAAIAQVTTSKSQFAGAVLWLVQHHQWVLATPAVLAVVLVVITVTDVLRRHTDRRRSARLVAAIVILNVGATTWYWARECLRLIRERSEDNGAADDLSAG